MKSNYEELTYWLDKEEQDYIDKHGEPPPRLLINLALEKMGMAKMMQQMSLHAADSRKEWEKDDE